MTPAGIEPAIFRFVTQHLKHCDTAVPKLSQRSITTTTKEILYRYSVRERNDQSVPWNSWVVGSCEHKMKFRDRQWCKIFWTASAIHHQDSLLTSLLKFRQYHQVYKAMSEFQKQCFLFYRLFVSLIPSRNMLNSWTSIKCEQLLMLHKAVLVFGIWEQRCIVNRTAIIGIKIANEGLWQQVSLLQTNALLGSYAAHCHPITWHSLATLSFVLQ
jgi:hypothetical protein